MRRVLPLVAIAVTLAFASAAHADLTIGDICRVKGQEEVTLQGLGLVVGLKGTGDGDSQPTSRALARMMSLMGNPVGRDSAGLERLKELSNAKNVALVFVSATVPAAGARQGDRINCRVNAIYAKSLDGGYLMTTPLLGPQPSDDPRERRVYALAQGLVHLSDPVRPAAAMIEKGCRLEENFFSPYISSDGAITLVIDQAHAGFQTAYEVADLIRNDPDQASDEASSEEMSQAIDSVNVRVKIPKIYLSDPVEYVQRVLTLRMLPPRNEARVVINERTGVIVIGAEVGIGPVVVTHKDLAIETGSALSEGGFVPLDTFHPTVQTPGTTPAAAGEVTDLKSLVDALNALRVPSPDIIEIIKQIQQAGKLYGRLVVQD
jgi:flagellar P-ring protein precursor FlgI